MSSYEDSNHKEKEGKHLMSVLTPMNKNPYVIKQSATTALRESKNSPSANATIRAHANTFRKNNLERK